MQIKKSAPTKIDAPKNAPLGLLPHKFPYSKKSACKVERAFLPIVKIQAGFLENIENLCGIYIVSHIARLVNHLILIYKQTIQQTK